VGRGGGFFFRDGEERRKRKKGIFWVVTKVLSNPLHHVFR
jgi:hypothetical protein